MKDELFYLGIEYIDSFVGFEILPNEEKDVTDRSQDDSFDQIPEEILKEHYD